MKRAMITHDLITSSLYPKILDFLIPVFKSLNLKVDIMSKETCKVSREKIFALSKKEFLNSPIEQIDYDDISYKAKEYLYSFIKSFDLLIVYEASKTFKQFMEDYNIRYIDIWVSPIRFYKDVILSFCSNDKSIQNKLYKYTLKEKKLYKQAEILKQQIPYLFEDRIKLKKNSALVIGQLFYDKSVLKNGKFLTLLDFKKELKKISKKYTKLYILKHPLMKEDEFKTILEGLKNIKKIEYLENINTYYLLSRKEIRKVIGISSSVLFEANYFGKKTHYFYKPVLDNSYIMIHKHFYKNSFWADILSIKQKENFTFLAHDNFLRYKYNLTYAYKEFMNDFHLQRNYKFLQKLYTFLNSFDKDKKYVLYGYGSIGQLIFPHIKKSLNGIVDKSLSIGSHIDEIPIISLKQVKKEDIVIITPFVYFQDIKQQLNKKNLQYINLGDFL